MLNGSAKSFEFQSLNEGVTVTAEPDIGFYTIPTTLTLERNRSYVLRFSKPGYRDATIQVRKGAQFGIIFLDVVLTGAIGIIVDAVTGDWNGLTPNDETVFLEKLDRNTPGPDRIRVDLSRPSDYGGGGERWRAW
jgi:hypothetical protein